VSAARAAADAALPRSLSRNCTPTATTGGGALRERDRLDRAGGRRGWRRWLDEFFLHPQWGLIGSLAVFALVLFFVFEVSSAIDAATSARLAAWVGQWQPESTAGIVGRAVADGLVGLVGIVVPYMVPLVVLLVTLENPGSCTGWPSSSTHGFHRIGLHGGVAVPFLVGLAARPGDFGRGLGRVRPRARGSPRC